MGKYGVTGTIKHFACNNQEFKRHDANSIVYVAGYDDVGAIGDVTMSVEIRKA